MIITLVGFSGCGKSELAKKIAAAPGWRSFVCDSMIEEALESVLPAEAHGTLRLAHWLGQPTAPGFRERQKMYSDAEANAVQTVCDALESTSPEENLVVDSTGSVVYLDAPVLERLRQLTTVVYLELSPLESDQMFRRYLENPKPLIWRDMYRPNPGEAEHDALARCYRALMEERTGMYERLAHRTLHLTFEERKQVTPKQLFDFLAS